MLIIKYYNKTATFKSFDGTLNAAGTPDLSPDNYDPVFSDIPCMLRPMGADDKMKRGKKVSDKAFMVYCQNLAIREDYIITIDNVNYRINGFKDPNSIGHHMEIECEIIQ